MGKQAGMLLGNPVLQNTVHPQGKHRIRHFLALVVLISFGRLADDQVVRQVIWISKDDFKDLAGFCGKTDSIVLHLSDQSGNHNGTVRLDNGTF